MSESAPITVDAAMAHAMAARRSGNIALAIKAARLATELAPDRLDAWFVWGTECMTAQKFNEAEQILGEGARRAPQGTPAQGRFLAHRAQALVTLGRGTDAVTAVSAAQACGLVDAASLDIMGTVLSQAGLPAEALPLLMKATEKSPKIAGLWYNLGGIQQFLGQMAQAESSYETAIQLSSHAAAHLALARLRRWNANANHVARLTAAPRISLHDEARLNYALFKEYDDMGDWDAAWKALEGGAHAASQLGTWSAAQEAAIGEAWRQTLPSERFNAKLSAERAGPRRIFIVGLPRSGTTLVERILASHSQVQALGELQTFALGVKRLSGVDSPNLLDAETASAGSRIDPRALGDYYTAETAYLHDGSAFTIDKLPHNHDYLGLIKLAFPDAILIHVRRSPMDSLFGAYKLLFAHAHRWSYAQADMADHFVNYRTLMAHWHECLGDDLIEVSLEAVIAEPETQIRQLLSACGLSFETACLSPHESKGAVTTASSAQVRRPINAEGIGAWRRYEAKFYPLLQRLTAAGFVDPHGNDLKGS